MKKMNRWFWFLARFAVYLVMNFLWLVIFFPLCRVAKKFNRPIFKFVFLVYPGTVDQVQGYIPLWCRAMVPTISFIGVVTGKHRGLVFSIPWTLEEIQEKNKGATSELLYIVGKIAKVANAIGVKAVALAGKIPGLLLRDGYSLLPPFVTGKRGAVYTVVASTRQAIEAVGLKFQDVVIGVLGGRGFIGSSVVSAFRDCGAKKIIVIDPRTQKVMENKIRFTRDPAEITSCDVVVILTARGEQAETILNFLKPGTIIIDDTHPQLPRFLINAIEQKKSGKVIKAVLTLDGVKFLPRLPKWEANWLPGCCIEAIVTAVEGRKIQDQTEFNRVAEEIGFSAPQVKIKSEL